MPEGDRECTIVPSGHIIVSETDPDLSEIAILVTWRVAQFQGLLTFVYFLGFCEPGLSRNRHSSHVAIRARS